MKKVSIVIPCYNAQDTIARCAKSLIAQTIGREELEFIFVNDGSTDRTYEALLAVEAICPDSVLIVNLDTNSGQGVARHAGMSYASGEYLGFLDADDFVEPDMYKKLYDTARKFGCTMVGGGYFVDSADGSVRSVSDSLPQQTYEEVDTAEKRKQLILSGTAVTFAARIYRTDFVRERGIYFPEGTLYEDNFWQSLMNTEIRSYYICKESFYHYVERAESSTKHPDENNFMQSMKMQTTLMEEYQIRGLTEQMPVELLAKFLKSHTVMNLLGMFLEWKTIPEAVYLQMKEDLAVYAGNSFENPYLWKADVGLLTDMFGEKLTEEERIRCMEQYSALLQKGRIQQWNPIFEKRREQKEHKAQQAWAAFQKKCFLLAYESERLQKEGSFLAKTESLLEEARQLGRFDDGTAYLEQMLSRGEEYHRHLEKISPILVYKGDSICYNVLNDFAGRLIASLRTAGEQVEVYDEASRGVQGLLSLCGRTFKAIIGFQTYLFGVKFQNGKNLHDSIYGPKYHFIFDHPLWMKEHLENGPQDYYVLTHGRDYQEFIQTYFTREVKTCFLLPPAGIVSGDINDKVPDMGQRTLDVTFIGTWYDYRERLLFIRNTKTSERYLANRFLLIMKNHPNLCTEEAFEQALSYYRISLDREAFKSVLFDMKQVCFAVMTYYREKVIRILLEQGIPVHVYGESWKKCPLAANPNLILHDAVSVEESLNVWRNSKISLNIMSWHKGGFTERIANIMLCGAVAVSDQSWYLKERLKDQKELILFDLERPEQLAEQIRYLLAHPDKMTKIADCGRKRALREHTWDVRTSQLLEIIEQR